MDPLLGGILLFGFLWALASGAKAAPAHPTGEKPEPEPEPGPGPAPSPAPAPGPSVTPHGGGPAPAPAPAPASAKPVPHIGPHIVPAKAEAPVPWPAATPKGLPAFPSGWEPDIPVQEPVRARAAQLLPELWKTGKPGKTKVEKTGDHWVTYLAFVPSKGKKGVAAYRTKAVGTAMTV